MVALGVILAAFVPIILSLANDGVLPLINRLTAYLGTVTFP
jgi:large-conductance mechanosensitive channel